MKKKLMMVTLLLAGLTMGACVDDKESASVTAVRDAKTEQLESVAAMNTAAAQAKQAMAAAEAALRLAEAQAQQAAAELAQAEAEYQKKQAELQELKNEQQTITNQARQAELERQLAELEVTKKRIEKEMAAIKAQMERAEIEAQTALLQAQAAMNKAQADLLDYEKLLASAKTEAERRRIQAERDHLTNLASDYSQAVNALNSAKSILNYYRRSLVTAENDLTSLQEGKESDIAILTNQIAQKQIQIDAYKKYANYTEDIDSLYLEYVKLEGAKNAAYDNWHNANYAFFNCTVNTEATEDLEEKVYSDVLYNLARYDKLVDEEGNAYLKSDETEVSVPNEIRNLRLLNVINKYEWNQKKGLTYTYEDGDYSSILSWGVGDSLFIDIEINEDLRQFELTVEDLTSSYKANLEAASNEVKKYQTAYNGEATLGGYPYNIQAQNPDGSLKFNEDGSPVMSTAKCTNLVDSTLNAKTKLDTCTVAANKDAYRNEYEAALQREKDCKDQLDDAILAEADAKLEQECLNKVIDIIRNFETYYTAFQANITARNEQSLKDYEEKVALGLKHEATIHARDIADSEFNAVKAIYSSSSDNNSASWIDSQISSLEGEIESLKEQIEDVSRIENQEEYIERLKARIEYYEQKVKVAEINANNAKAALEEALAKYGEAEE